MKHRILVASALALALAAVAPRALALNPDAEKPHVAAMTEGFLKYHPDLRWRRIGLQRFEDGDHADALNAFIRSSRFADKGAQAMVAEMYWTGQGTPVDRALAYAWMDLAAERGYKDFLKIRERYWNQLDDAERSRALDVGKEIYAEYGDEVAKPRLSRQIEKGRRNVTGSRTGFVGSMTVLVPGNGTWITLDGTQYYEDRFWKPEQYFEWQDQIWREPYRGVVEVGEITQADPEPGTEVPAAKQ